MQAKEVPPPRRYPEAGKSMHGPDDHSPRAVTAHLPGQRVSHEGHMIVRVERQS